MVDQTSVERTAWQPPRGNGHRQSAAAGVRDGVGELLSDIVELGELQAELAMVDARESMQKAVAPVVLLVVGAVLGLGAVPVLLLALGEALHEFGGLERTWSYLISGAVGAALAGLLAWLGYRKVGDVLEAFNRSRAELSENIRWVKYALTRGRRPPRSPYPNPPKT